MNIEALLNINAAESETKNDNQATIKKISSKSKAISPTSQSPQLAKQPFDVFLVVDFEGTCDQGTNFDYPNEIIEFPVSVLRWTDKDKDGRANVLEVVNEFRTFVKPKWRPNLSDFCKELTGITQDQVDSAPIFTEALTNLEVFLVKNGLLESGSRRSLQRFCWCTDGPWDFRDLFVKQCFISQVDMPWWIKGDIVDVRRVILQWMKSKSSAPSQNNLSGDANRPSLNIPAQLKLLGLPVFEGRQHSGIDDTRNIARIVTELALRGVRLLPNTAINPGKRWNWMGKKGQVLHDT